MSNINFNSKYSKDIKAQMKAYNDLSNAAFFANIESGGAPTKKEAMLYEKMVTLCNEIISMSSREPGIRSKWEQLRNDAYHKFSVLVAQLKAAEGAPVPPQNQGGVHPAPPPFVNNGGGQPTAAPTSAPPEGGNFVKTKSGFVTRNASREVPAETIEKWYKPAPIMDFSAVIGMAEMKERLMEIAEKHKWEETNKLLGISPFSCCLFYGPPGTGKTFIIEAFVAELMKDGFTYMQLQSADIHASYVGVAEKTVQTAFREAIDHAPCVIYIDEFEDVSVERNDPKAEGHEKRLTVALIEEYNTLLKAGKPIILLAATNHPRKMEMAWIDRFNQTGGRFLLPLPSEEQRKLYFEHKMKLFPLTEGLTIDRMVDETDNYSYRDLDGLTGAIQAAMLAKAKKKCRADGNDIGKIDPIIRDMFKNKELTLSLEEFEELRRSKPASPKEEIIRALREYDERAANYQGE